jgi:hypothetical protein
MIQGIIGRSQVVAAFGTDEIDLLTAFLTEFGTFGNLTAAFMTDHRTSMKTLGREGLSRGRLQARSRIGRFHQMAGQPFAERQDHF